MPVPAALTAMSAAKAAAAATAASEAAVGVASQAAAAVKNQLLPTVVRIDNQTRYNLELAPTNGMYRPTAGGIDGRPPTGSAESYNGKGLEDRVIWSDLFKPGQQSDSCSFYGNGLDSVAGCLTYYRRPVDGVFEGERPMLGITFAFWCVAGKARAAVLFHSSGNPWKMDQIWKPTGTRDFRTYPLSTIPWSPSWVYSIAPLAVPPSGYHSSNWDGAASYGDDARDFVVYVSMNDNPQPRQFHFTVTEVGYEPWTYELTGDGAPPIPATAAAGDGVPPTPATAAAATADDEWNPQLTATSVNGQNAAEVVAGADGERAALFRQTGPTRWKEFDATGATARFDFGETGRDEWSVYLRDDSRNVGLQLDLHRKMVVYTGPDGNRFDLYPIVESRGTGA